MIIPDAKKNTAGVILSRVGADGRSSVDEAKEQEPSSQLILAGKIREAIASGNDQDLVDALTAFLAAGE